MEENSMDYMIDFCIKVSEQKWIKSLRNGTACFNPVGIFIEKAENDGNNEQGDRYEGIFARIKKTDPRLETSKHRYADDLEILPDGENHVMLRRKSSRNVPVFCMYGVRRDELVLDEASVHTENGELFGKAKYTFPDKIYHGFLDTDDVWGFYASSGHFCTELENALNCEGLTYRKCVIRYDIDLETEFYFEPDDEYSELNHKRKDLIYQHEIRYKLLNYPRNEMYLLKYTPLSEHSCGVAPGALYLEMRCKCNRLEE